MTRPSLVSPVRHRKISHSRFLACLVTRLLVSNQPFRIPSTLHAVQLSRERESPARAICPANSYVEVLIGLVERASMADIASWRRIRWYSFLPGGAGLAFRNYTSQPQSAQSPHAAEKIGSALAAPGLPRLSRPRHPAIALPLLWQTPYHSLAVHVWRLVSLLQVAASSEQRPSPTHCLCLLCCRALKQMRWAWLQIHLAGS